MSQKQQFDTDRDLLCPKTVADLKSLSTDLEWFVELLAVYEDQTQALMGSLAKAIQTRATQKGLDLAHTLKSSNFQVGAQRMGQTFLEIESALELDNFKDAQKIYERLPAMFEKTLLELQLKFTEGLKP